MRTSKLFSNKPMAKAYGEKNWQHFKLEETKHGNWRVTRMDENE